MVVSIGTLEKALIAFGGATVATLAAEGGVFTSHTIGPAVLTGLGALFATLGYKAVKT